MIIIIVYNIYIYILYYILYINYITYLYTYYILHNINIIYYYYNIIIFRGTIMSTQVFSSAEYEVINDSMVVTNISAVGKSVLSASFEAPFPIVLMTIFTVSLSDLWEFNSAIDFTKIFIDASSGLLVLQDLCAPAAFTNTIKKSAD